MYQPEDDEPERELLTIEAFKAKWKPVMANQKRPDPVPSVPMTADEISKLRRGFRAWMGRPAQGCARCGYGRFKDGRCQDCGLQAGER